MKADALIVFLPNEGKERGRFAFIPTFASDFTDKHFLMLHLPYQVRRALYSSARSEILAAGTSGQLAGSAGETPALLKAAHPDQNVKLEPLPVY